MSETYRIIKDAEDLDKVALNDPICFGYKLESPKGRLDRVIPDPKGIRLILAEGRTGLVQRISQVYITREGEIQC